MMSQLLITLFLVVGLTVNVSGQSLAHPSDDCIDGPRNTSTHERVPGFKIFCMGSKDNVISYGMKEGCFNDTSCDFFMSAKIVINPQVFYNASHVLWNLYAKDGNMIFFLSKQVMNMTYHLDKDLDIRNITLLKTEEYPRTSFVSFRYPNSYINESLAGTLVKLWGKSGKKDLFYKDYGGDPSYQEKTSLLVGFHQIEYNRVAVTTWNQGNDTDKTYVPNARIYPVVPYLIGVKNKPNSSEVSDVTVISPEHLIQLFADDTKGMPLNAAAGHFNLGGDNSITMKPKDKTGDFVGMLLSYIWVVIAVSVLVILLVIITIYRFCGKKSKKTDSVIISTAGSSVASSEDVRSTVSSS